VSKLMLIVDDDPEMLSSLKEGLQRYRDTFSVITADSGRKGLKQIREKPVSLLITDLKMPDMDGFDLLGRVMESYPDIPVIIMTGYSTPEMKRLAEQGGAVGYIAKPFLVEELARKIITVLRKESEGGTLHGVSSGIFLQLIEMEERTCTIRLKETRKGQKGALFFKDGELLDARFGNIHGVEAAYKIFSWDDVSISIQNGCARIDRVIEEDLQAVLLEAMRRKDEFTAEASAQESKEPDVPAAFEADDPEEASAESGELTNIRRRVEADLGGRAGIQEMYRDEKWDGFVARFDELARALGAGILKVALLDQGVGNCKVLLPNAPTTVIEVTHKCPRDRLIQILGRQRYDG